MDFEQAAVLIGSLLGGGGIVALIKSRSDIRNANKAADIAALKETILTIQNSYKELQDRYQEMLGDNENKCKSLSDRLQFLEIEYVKQSQQNGENLKRITELEIDLRKANGEIESLKGDLRKKDIDVMRLEQENIELRKQQNKMSLMQ
jgi:chromosome segregation ATPase